MATPTRGDMAEARRIQKGQKIGEAQIYIDLSVVGLGTYGPVSYDVLADEPVSYVVLKAILGRDMGEPFGTAKTSLGWATCDYSGTTPETGFYLRALDDGNSLGNRAEALSGDWSSYGSDAASVYAAIDQYFQGSVHKEEKAALWRCIYNNKIPLTPASASLANRHLPSIPAGSTPLAARPSIPVRPCPTGG